MSFSLQQFIEDCRHAIGEPDSQAVIAEHIKQAIERPAEVVNELGEPKLAGLNTLYNADDLTILNIVWAPGMTLHPHNHCMWADIGIYGGQEENNFYRKTEGGLVQQGQALLQQGDVAPLHKDVIHGVHNPLSKLTAAIHVYGGDFFTAPRSEWTGDALEEHPYDIAHTRAVFAEANARLDPAAAD